MKLTNLTHRVAATVSTLSIISSSAAFATTDTDLTAVTGNIQEAASGIPALISTASYICGIGLGATGIFKLKQHVDDPGKEPMKNGLVRLASGGALLALPYMTEAMQGSMGGAADGVAFSDLSGAFSMSGSGS